LCAQLLELLRGVDVLDVRHVFGWSNKR
jgi:hypothetical protein